MHLKKSWQEYFVLYAFKKVSWYSIRAWGAIQRGSCELEYSMRSKELFWYFMRNQEVEFVGRARSLSIEGGARSYSLVGGTKNLSLGWLSLMTNKAVVEPLSMQTSQTGPSISINTQALKNGLPLDALVNMTSIGSLTNWVERQRLAFSRACTCLMPLLFTLNWGPRIHK